MTDRSGSHGRFAWLLLLIVVAMLPLPDGAVSAQRSPAREVSTEEVVALLEAAVDDDEALAEVRAVEQVDGRPVDLDAATAGLADEPDLRAARLRGLAEAIGGLGNDSSGGGGELDPEAAREAASEVLEDRKYRPSELPRPLAGPLEWMADRLRPLGDAWDSVSGAVLRFADRIPGGRFLLFVALVGVAAAAVGWLVGRRSRAAVDRARSSALVDLSLDPAHLERAADDAELAGDHARSVRLRYEAGLLCLVAGGRLDLTPATTATGAAIQVDEPAMDEATLTFQEVVYGGRAATEVDCERSRQLWSDLVGAGARR